jgi:branched-chain amino acid transport system ATP-binding protein
MKDMNDQVVGEAKRREPVDHSKNANHASTAPAFFSCWDVHAYYGESYIVQGVSFNIHEGEILALLGRNGAGKTSTLRAIARTGSPMVTQGEIWLDHKPLHQMKSHEAAQHGLAQFHRPAVIHPGLLQGAKEHRVNFLVVFGDGCAERQLG